MFLASLGMAMGLAGMILEVFLMVLLKKLELLFFFYFDFIFYWNFKSYMFEKYRLEGRDQYGFKIDDKELQYIPPTETTSNKILFGVGFLIFLLLMTLVVRIALR